MIQSYLKNKYSEYLDGLDIYEDGKSILVPRIVIKNEYTDTMIRYPKINESTKLNLVMSEQKNLIKKLLREAIDLSVTDESIDTEVFNIDYKGRDAGEISLGPAPLDLGEDTLEIVDLTLNDDYKNINTANQAVKSLWVAKPKINRLIVQVPPASRLFWEKLGFSRLNDTYHELFRGH